MISVGVYAISTWTYLRSFVSIQRHSQAASNVPTKIQIPALYQRQPILTHLNAQATLRRSSGPSSVDTNVLPLLEIGATNKSMRNPQTSTHWIRGVYLCGYAAFGLLLLNITLMSVVGGLASMNPGNGGSSNSKVIYRGSCTTTERWNTGLHVIINIISTCVIAAGNYCMQTLVAPNRDEVDGFHKNGRWLDIGGPSIRNLSAISLDRLGLWLILFFTTVPFHLLYNSMIFESLSVNLFWSFIGPHDFAPQHVADLATPALEKCFVNVILPMNYNGGSSPHFDWNEQVFQIIHGKSRKIPLEQCYDYYKAGSPSGYKGLVFLSGNLSISQGGNTSLLSPSEPYPITWDNPRSAPAFPFVKLAPLSPPYLECVDAIYLGDNTTLQDEEGVYSDPPYNLQMIPLESCLGFEGKVECQLFFSPLIAIIVSVASLLKVTAMFLAAWVHRSRSPPLLTVGDAVASFLEQPDQTTDGICWASAQDIKMGKWKFVDIHEQQLESPSMYPLYKRLSPPVRWLRASSKSRWIITSLFSAGGLIAGALMTYSLATDPNSPPFGKSWTSLWDTENSVRESQGGNRYSEVQGAVIANCPQIAVSVGYFLYNGLLTKMLLAAEYSRYGVTRAPLRVTWPIKGSQQRSTYWLSVPYKYGIPIMFSFTAIHWFVSQSFSYFLLIPYGLDDKPLYGNRASQTAFSGLPAMFASLIGLLLNAFMAILAFQRLASYMPLAGSCSAAISAACHLPNMIDKSTAAQGKLIWADTGLPMRWQNDEEDNGRKGHCGFTPLDAEQPSLDKIYA